MGAQFEPIEEVVGSPYTRGDAPSTTHTLWHLHLDLRRLQGQVYTQQYAKSTFARECLGEYCQYQYQGEPLFRTPDTQSQTGLSLENRCAGSLESVAAEEIRLV